MPVAAVTASPVNDYAAADNLVNTVLENLTEEKLKAIGAAVEKQQPEIEKQIKTLAPLLKEISTKATAMAAEINNNYIVPAALEETDASKQIVVREEQSGSKNALVKVYTLIFKNGQWVLRPEWKLAAKENKDTGSLHNIDSSAPLAEPQIAY